MAYISPNFGQALSAMATNAARSERERLSRPENAAELEALMKKYEAVFNPPAPYRAAALEGAAKLCDESADLYAAYAGQTGRDAEQRSLFQRDYQTCADLARRIRALKPLSEE